MHTYIEDIIFLYRENEFTKYIIFNIYLNILKYGQFYIHTFGIYFDNDNLKYINIWSINIEDHIFVCIVYIYKTVPEFYLMDKCHFRVPL